MNTRPLFTLALVAGIFANQPAGATILTWDTVSGNGTITGGAGFWDTATTNWTGDGGLTNQPWVNGPNDDTIFAGATAGTVSVSENITLGNLSFNLTNYTLAGNSLTFAAAAPTITTGTNVFGTIASVVAGGNGLSFGTVAGGGTYLDGNNTYSGLTNVNSGYLVLRHANALGSGGPGNGTVVTSGATVQLENTGNSYNLSGDIHISNEAITISGTGVGGARGALSSWTGNNSWSGDVTMAASSSIHVQTGSLALPGVVSGTALNLTKTGGGQLSLVGSSANTYSGTTIVDNGTLLLGKSGGSAAIIGSVQMGAVNANQPNLRMAANNQFGPGVVMTFVNASGNWTRFDLQGTSQTLAGIQCTTGGGIVQNERVGAGGTSSAGTLTIDNSADYSFTGYMRDRDGGQGLFLLNIVKNGTGRQTIAGANVNYSGTTVVNQGTYELQTTLNYSSATTVAAGAILELNGAAINAQHNSGLATIALAGTVNRTGSVGWMVWNGKLSPTAGTATLHLRNAGAVPGNGNGWLFLDGGIGSTGAQTLTINHTLADGVTANNDLATVLRNNNSTYTGSLTVNNGSLVVTGGAGGTGTQLANTDVTLGNATLQFASVFASTQNTANQLKSVSGTGTVSLGGSALTVGMNNGTGSFSGAVTGTGSVTKIGSGTQTFSGANGYSGATAVNEGTLRLDYATQDNTKLSDAAALTLGGGTVELVGGNHPEIVQSTTLTAGTASSVIGTPGAATLQMNAITRNAGSSLTFSAANIATTDNFNDASGILGTWATVGGDWAINSTNGLDQPITAFAAYANVNRLGGTIATGLTSNVKIIEAGASGDVTMAAGGTTSVNTLLQGANGGTATVDVGAGNVLRFGASGGIFLPSGNSALNVNNGTLTAGGADNTAGVVEVNNLDATNGIAIQSAITDNGIGVVSLSKIGLGSLTLTGANAYTGGSSITGGTLAFDNGSLGSTGTITAGTATLSWNGTNTQDISGRLALLAGATTTLNTNGNNVSFASGLAATTAGLTKSGAGTLTLSGANAHSGLTTIQTGTLELNHANALQNSTLDVGSSGAQQVTFALAGANTYNVGGLQGADAVDVGANTLSVGANNGSTNYSGAISGSGGGLTKVGVGALTLSGATSNTYTGATTFASNGHLVLSKTGGAVAIPGDLLMAAPGTRGIVSTTQDNQFAPGSVLRFTSAGDTRLELKGTTQTFGGIENSSVVTKVYHSIQHSEFGPPNEVDKSSLLILDVAAPNTFNFNTNSGSIRDYNGGQVSLVKNGLGKQILTGGGTAYSGPTALNAGTLELANASGYYSATTVASGATLILSNTASMGMGHGAAFTLNSGAVLTHNGTVTNNAYIVLNGAFTVSGTTTINQDSVTNVSGANKNLFLDGGLHGTGTLTITAANAGNAVVFRNNNSTFAGTIIVNGIASTTVNAGSGIAVGGATTTLQNADITLNGTMEMLNQGLGWAGNANGDFAMGALNGNGVMIANFTGAGQTRVKLGYTNADGDFSGIIANGAGAGNTVVLSKFGSGKQTLSGTNTYTGATNVVEGELNVNGSIATSSLVTVENGGILSGNGTVGAVSALTGSWISPGNSPGMLSTGTVTTQQGANLLIEIGGANPASQYDQVNTSGGINLGGGVLVVNMLSGYVPAYGQTFTIWNNDLFDSVTGTFTGLPEGTYFPQAGTPGGFYVSYQGDTGNDVVLTYIPEPAAGLLTFATLWQMLLRRRR